MLHGFLSLFLSLSSSGSSPCSVAGNCCKWHGLLPSCKLAKYSRKILLAMSFCVFRLAKTFISWSCHSDFGTLPHPPPLPLPILLTLAVLDSFQFGFVLNAWRIFHILIDKSFCATGLMGFWPSLRYCTRTLCKNIELVWLRSRKRSVGGICLGLLAAC